MNNKPHAHKDFSIRINHLQRRDMNTGYLVAGIDMFLIGTKSKEQEEQTTAIYAVSQYDSDGFTIFPTKSSDYMSGYRVGVIQADKDVQLFNADKLPGIDANQDKIKCPPDSFNADFCSGYKDGYSDEAMDQLE